jgi:CheY-like chemotaxis protein
MMRRVLLIDDDDAIREIARISLERVGGWEVLSAGSGQAAIKLTERSSLPDVVLIDVMMPGLDGPSTMRRLKAGPLRGGETPFVFLTAKLQAADLAKLAELGAAGVIAKPFDPMTLPEQLDRILAEAPPQRVHAAFAEQWLRARPTIECRLDTIDAALTPIAEGHERSRTGDAIAEAHKLAGTLGTFGLGRGSDLASRLEEGLQIGKDSNLCDLAGELRRLVEEARVDAPLRDEPVPSA